MRIITRGEVASTDTMPTTTAKAAAAAAAAVRRSSTRRRVTDLYVTRGCLRRTVPRRHGWRLFRRNDDASQRCSCTDAAGAARRGVAQPARRVRDVARACVLYSSFSSRLSLLPSRLAGDRPDAVASRSACNSGRPTQRFHARKLGTSKNGERNSLSEMDGFISRVAPEKCVRSILRNERSKVFDRIKAKNIYDVALNFCTFTIIAHLCFANLLL